MAERGLMVSRRPFWKYINFHLAVGSVMVLLLALIAWLGPSLVPEEPQRERVTWTDSTGQIHITPIRPYEYREFPLGSDIQGRDVFSRLLWAVKPTLTLAAAVAVTRLLLGATLGYLRGWYEEKLVGRIIISLTQTAASLPLIVLAIVLLHVIELRDNGVMPFMIALNVTGWAGVSQFVAKRVRTLRGEQFIEAARAMGGGDFHILLKHVIPDLRVLLPILLSFEMGAVLLQLAELGFLGFFLGGGAGGERAGAVDTLAGATSGVLPELGQMLSSGWDNFFRTPWVAAWAGTAFFIAVFAFMILGEGLKRYNADETSPKPLERLRSALTRV